MACDICKGINTDQCPVCGNGPQYVTCPKCVGSGHYPVWYAIDRRTGEEIEVKELTWDLLPSTEAEAREKRSNYYRAKLDECELCDGFGIIEKSLIPHKYNY